MAFTGKLGTVNSMPSQLVPMYGAGGTKRSKSLTGNLAPAGGLSSIHGFIFSQVSITAYRAVFRARQFITTLRTST